MSATAAVPFPTADVTRRHRGLRVLMLNPSSGAPAYTHNLCDALVHAGCEVELFTSPQFARASRCWREITYTPRIAFYRRTQQPSYHAGRLTRPAWQLLRLAGHLTSLARLPRAVGRYDVLHLPFPPVAPVDARWVQLIRGLVFRVVRAGAPYAPTPPYRDLPRELRDLAHELGIEDRVMFHFRYVEEEEVPSFLEAASVVALPYRAIDQSGAAIAALTMGR